MNEYLGGKNVIVIHHSPRQGQENNEITFSRESLIQIGKWFSLVRVTGFDIELDGALYNIKPFLDLFRKNRKIIQMRHIKVKMSTMTEENKKDLLDFIREFPSVEELSLWQCKLSDKDAPMVIEMIRASSICNLNLRRNDFSGNGICKIVHSVPVAHWARLKRLDMSYNRIENAGGLGLSNLIWMGNLTALYINDCQLGTVATAAILYAAACSNIEILELTNGMIDDKEGAVALKYFLENNGNIRELCLKFCTITDSVLDKIAPVIYKCPRLWRLNIKGNHALTVGAVLKMLDTMQYHPKLGSLDVCFCEEPWPTPGVYVKRVEERLRLFRKFRSMIAIVSTRAIKRIGSKSPLSILPIDVFRVLQVMLE